MFLTSALFLSRPSIWVEAIWAIGSRTAENGIQVLQFCDLWIFLFCFLLFSPTSSFSIVDLLWIWSHPLTCYQSTRSIRTWSPDMHLSITSIDSSSTQFCKFVHLGYRSKELISSLNLHIIFVDSFVLHWFFTAIMFIGYSFVITELLWHQWQQ